MNNVSKVKGYEHLSGPNQIRLDVWLNSETIIQESEMKGLLPVEAFKVSAISQLVRDIEPHKKYEAEIERMINSVARSVIAALKEATPRIGGKPFTLEFSIINKTANNGMQYQVDACFGVYE